MDSKGLEVHRFRARRSFGDGSVGTLGGQTPGRLARDGGERPADGRSAEKQIDCSRLPER